MRTLAIEAYDDGYVLKEKGDVLLIGTDADCLIEMINLLWRPGEKSISLITIDLETRQLSFDLPAANV